MQLDRRLSSNWLLEGRRGGAPCCRRCRGSSWTTSPSGARTVRAAFAERGAATMVTRVSALPGRLRYPVRLINKKNAVRIDGNPTTREPGGNLPAVAHRTPVPLPGRAGSRRRSQQTGNAGI